MFAYIFVRTLQIDCCDIYFMRITKNRRIKMAKYSKTDLGAMSEIAKSLDHHVYNVNETANSTIMARLISFKRE